MGNLFSSFLVAKDPKAPIPWYIWVANTCIVGAAVTIAIGFALNKNQLKWDWSAVTSYSQLFLSGWKTTLFISFCSLITSGFLGLFLTFGYNSQFLPLRISSKLYIELIRGTPLLAQIYIFFYIIAESAHLENRYIAGVLTLSIFSSAYIAEIIRAGIGSVGASQIESAKAIGLTRIQTYRHVVFPQAFRSILPPLSGQFISLIKDSSLLSIIGLNELTQNAKNVASYTFSNFESYLILALGYLVLTLPLSLWTRHLEKNVRYET